MLTRPHPFRPWALGAVGALHLVMLMLWPDRPAGREPAGPAQAPLVVELLRAPAPQPVPELAEPRERLPAIQAVNPPAPLWTAPFVATPPVQEADARPTVGLAPPHGPAPGPGPASPPALNLRLPPPEQRLPAPTRPLDAPRPRSVESRLAQDLASSPLREQAMGDGRRRVQQGRHCVELRDARMAQIDPFNQSVSPIPKQAEDCAR